jgi:hypothetical protein
MNTSCSTCSQFVNFRLQWPENPNNLVTRHSVRDKVCGQKKIYYYVHVSNHTTWSDVLIYAERRGGHKMTRWK